MMEEDNGFFSYFSGKADGLKKDLACLIVRFFLHYLLLKLSLLKTSPMLPVICHLFILP